MRKLSIMLLLLCGALLILACGGSSPPSPASPSSTTTGTTAGGGGSGTGGSGGGGTGNSPSCPSSAGGISPSSVAVDPGGQFAYVVGSTSCPDGEISVYSINPTTGVLTAAGPAVDSGDEGTIFVAVDPSGKFVYTANWGAGDTAGSVSAFTINPATATLTSTGTMGAPCAPPPSPGSCAPSSLAVHPSGKFVYVANEGGFSPTSVSAYAITAGTGALTLIETLAVDGRALAVAVDPSGKFAYVADGGQYSNGAKGTNISMYTIDATTGALTSIGAIAAGTSPTSVTVDPSGKFVYVANMDSNNVSMYTIDATTGALTSIGLIAAGTAPVSVAVDPSGKFAYAANSASNDISMYMINTANGTLTSIGTIATGSSPRSIAIHPSGKFAYVTNSNTVSMYTIDATTGALSLIGTIGT